MIEHPRGGLATELKNGDVVVAMTNGQLDLAVEANLLRRV